MNRRPEDGTAFVKSVLVADVAPGTASAVADETKPEVIANKPGKVLIDCSRCLSYSSFISGHISLLEITRANRLKSC